MNPTLQALENQYFSLRTGLSALQQKGATDAQLAELRGLVVQSRTNYLAALNNALKQGDAEVQRLTAEVQREQGFVDEALKHLEDVAKVLNVIATAVKIGTTLIGAAMGA